MNHCEVTINYYNYPPVTDDYYEDMKMEMKEMRKQLQRQQQLLEQQRRQQQQQQQQGEPNNTNYVSLALQTDDQYMHPIHRHWTYKKLSYCWETVRRESMPRKAEVDVEMTT